MIEPTTIKCDRCEVPKDQGRAFLGMRSVSSDGVRKLEMQWSFDLPILLRFEHHYCSVSCLAERIAELLPDDPNRFSEFVSGFTVASRSGLLDPDAHLGAVEGDR